MGCEDKFLEILIAKKIQSTVIITNGFQVKGKIVAQDANTILVECSGHPNHLQMVYKTAISTIDPSVDVKIK